MTYRPRRLKQAKSPMSAAARRYFFAPQYTVDDYYLTVEECKAGVVDAPDQLLSLYYFQDWREIYRDHRVALEAEFVARFPDREDRAAHRRWALQGYQDRLRMKFLAERDKARVN